MILQSCQYNRCVRKSTKCLKNRSLVRYGSDWICFFFLFFNSVHVVFSVVLQSLSHVWLFGTPWTAARQASRSFTISWSWCKLTSMRSVMPLAAIFSNWAYFRLKGAGSKDLRTTKVYSLTILKATCPIQDGNKPTLHLKAVGRILSWMAHACDAIYSLACGTVTPVFACLHLHVAIFCVFLSFSVPFIFTFTDLGIIQESACSAGDLGSIPGLGRSPGEGNGNRLQYSCLENFMERGAWWATIYGVAKESDTTEWLTHHFFTLMRYVLF